MIYSFSITECDIERKSINMYQLNYYVPEDEHENLKQHLFKSGAGQFDNYDQCCWQTLGEGQFRPLKNSKPYSGTHLQLHSTKEYKVEMICKKKYLKAALKSLLKYHPYEQPAYHVIKITTAKSINLKN